MTTAAFLSKLCEITGEDLEGIASRGRHEGWLEEEDQLYPGRDISRKNVARILHMYLLKVRGIKDIGDIEPAYELRDLFDCRVCANHVAQIYLRGIMDAKNLMNEEKFLWFDLDGIDDDTSVTEAIRHMNDIKG